MSEFGKILVVDDEPDVCTVIAGGLEEDGLVVDICHDAATGTERLNTSDYALAFVDINLPDQSGLDLLEQYRANGGTAPIIIITGRATVANAIEATSRGAYDYVTKPFDLDKLREMTREVLERAALQAKLGSLKTRVQSDFAPGVEIIGSSPAMQEIYKLIGRVARTTATVLIQGESGSGKELIAKSLHAYSDRWDQPFVAINCSAIPLDLLESEMFGHERGAFTGATERHVGKFEQAGAGTLFLDELIDLPLPLQAKLLRVIQEREFSPVGGRALLPARCRIIAATNKSLEERVSAGSFREDLLFRLKVVVLSVPPLRDRRDDISELVDFFVDRINRNHQFKIQGVAPDAMSLLTGHEWPGNVRELENILVRAAAVAPNRVLTAADIPLGTTHHRTLSRDLDIDEFVSLAVREYLTAFGSTLPRDLYTKTVAMVEKPLIEAVLERTKGNQLRAAEILGINRNTLRKKITDLGIEIDRQSSN